MDILVNGGWRKVHVTIINKTLIHPKFILHAFVWIVSPSSLYSGVDTSNNSSNPDTSKKFFKKYPYVILSKINHEPLKSFKLAAIVHS